MSPVQSWEALLIVTSVTGQNPSCLFYITDCSTNLQLLVDTSAKVSVISPTPVQCKHPQNDFQLQAVNNSPIATYGSKLLKPDLGL